MLRRPGVKFGLLLSTLISLTIAVGAIVIGLIYTNLTRDLPSLAVLPDLLDPPGGLLLQPTRLYDRTGNHQLLTLENPAASEREYLTLDSSQKNYLPVELISATLASADPGFWSHAGYAIGQFEPQQHPTLAQQLISDLVLWDEPPGLRRALRERLLAAQLTARFGRQQVLTWYLNSANYGRLAFGADAASRAYFGKSAAQLSLAEAALLAGVAEAPALNPIDAPQAALERMRKTIQTMEELDFIQDEQARLAVAETPSLQPASSGAPNIAPAYLNLVLEQISHRYNMSRLQRGGVRIITTLDYPLQLQTACATSTQLERLSIATGLPPPPLDSDCETARLLSTLASQATTPLQEPGAAAIVFEPASGQVLALVGGLNPGQDPAHPPGRPSGTLLTPFIYLTGFTRGLSPGTMFWDIPVTPPELEEFDGDFHGPVRLRTALANDYLTPAAQVITQVGMQNVQRIAQQLGLELDQAFFSSPINLAQGSQTTLLDVSQAYSVFANQGIMVGEQTVSQVDEDGLARLQAVTILEITDVLGRRVPATGEGSDQSALSHRPVINPQLAYLITHILSDETARWPSLGHPNPLEIGRPVAAKLGRTESGQDAWTVGYTPQLLVGVWVGEQNNSSSGQVHPSAAASLWHAIIQYALRELPSQDWPIPPGINQVQVCEPSGLLPSQDCPTIVPEVFLAGSEPTQVDTLYQSVQVNRETGRLATVFTPPELVERRSYLIVPPEAAAWARQSNLPTPPDEYDILQSSSGSTTSVEISSPQMFAYVSGQVSVQGSAGGDDFQSYRLQVGQGLNPGAWLQIGEEVQLPINEGELGVWDTQGLDGLYAVQLLVIGQDQRLKSAVVQVTVDNQPPEITILSPTPDQVITPGQRSLTLVILADDNLDLEKVEFFMDGQLMETLVQPPFSIPWQPRPGSHRLQVVVTDRAGNQTRSTVEFTVSG